VGDQIPAHPHEPSLARARAALLLPASADRRGVSSIALWGLVTIGCLAAAAVFIAIAMSRR
jgi:hypothetical protein